MNVVAGEFWFWWIAPILTVGVVVTVLALSGGYVKQVLVPRIKGRRVEE